MVVGDGWGFRPNWAGPTVWHGSHPPTPRLHDCAPAHCPTPPPPGSSGRPSQLVFLAWTHWALGGRQPLPFTGTRPRWLSCGSPSPFPPAARTTPPRARPTMPRAAWALWCPAPESPSLSRWGGGWGWGGSQPGHSLHCQLHHMCLCCALCEQVVVEAGIQATAVGPIGWVPRPPAVLITTQ
jgi:hypothetical protein